MKDNKNNIFENLKNKGTGFSSPENYLDNFEQTFFQEKKQAAHKITGFVMPEDYFDTLDNKILEGNALPKVIRLKRRKKIKIISLMAAASILLVFGFSNFEFNKNKWSMDKIETSELENWLENDLIGYNTYEISEIFTDTDLDLANIEIDENLYYLDFTEVENLILEN